TPSPGKANWFYAQEKPQPIVLSAVQALERDGFRLAVLEGSSRSLAEKLAASYVGGIVFTSDAAMVACIANKVTGVRAAAVVNVAHTTQAKKSVGANL